MTILTPRLALKPLTVELLDAQLSGHPSFFKRLSVAPQTEWPPPFYDDAALAWTHARLSDGEDPRWHIRLIATRGRLFRPARAIGVAGFKGPPDARGEVEIGYSVVASEQRRGYGAEAVAALVAFAFRHSEVALVSAHTLADDVTAASRRVLEGANFAGPFPTEEFGVVRYELARETR